MTLELFPQTVVYIFWNSSTLTFKPFLDALKVVDIVHMWDIM